MVVLRNCIYILWKPMGKYSTIQITKETLKLLNDYCAEHGYSKSGLVEKLIKDKVKKPLPTTNVLRVNT